MKKYEMLEKIGDGAYGFVYKAKDKSTGEIVAIKQLKKICKDYKELYSLREIKTLYFLNRQKCENIVKLKNVIRETNGTTYIIFDYSDQCLRNLIENNERNKVLFEEDSIKKIIFQVSLGLEFIHKMGFFHRDIKPDNILILENSIIKITDFGFAIKNKSFSFKDHHKYIRRDIDYFEDNNLTYLNIQEKNSKNNSNYSNTLTNNYSNQNKNLNYSRSLNPIQNINLNAYNNFNTKKEIIYTEDYLCEIPNNEFFEKFKNYNKKEFENYLNQNEILKNKNNDKYTDYICTRYYRPPECLFKSNIYGIEIDIWALGTMLAEMYLSKPLFEANSDPELFEQFCQIMGTPLKSEWLSGYEKLESLNIKIKHYERKQIFEVIPNITEDAADLLMKILVWDPKKRPNINEILEHRYFSEIKDRKFYKKLGLGKRYTLNKKTIIAGFSPKYRLKKNNSPLSKTKNALKIGEYNMSNINNSYSINEHKSTNSDLNNSINAIKGTMKKERKKLFLKIDSPKTNNLNIELKFNEKELDIEELKQNYLIKSENYTYQKSPTNYIMNNTKKIEIINTKIPNITNFINIKNNINDKENNLKNFNKIIIDRDRQIKNKEDIEIKEDKNYSSNIKIDPEKNNIQAFSYNRKKYKLKLSNEIKLNKLNKLDNLKEDPNKISLFSENENKSIFDNVYEIAKDSNSPTRKKNLYNINIANTKSPRYIPIIVNRPVESFKGNFLNDFHKNTIRFPIEKKLNLNPNSSLKNFDSDKNSAISPKNFDFVNVNILTFNVQEREKETFKFPDQLPLLGSPFNSKKGVSSDLNSNRNKSDEFSLKNCENNEKFNERKKSLLKLLRFI